MNPQLAMTTSPDKYSDEYRKKQAAFGKKGKKVGKGHFYQLKQSGKLGELSEIAKKGRASQKKV